MKNSERVLIAVDDSEATDRVAAYVGCMLAGLKDCRVHLFHVVEPVPPLFLSLTGDLSTPTPEPPGSPEAHLVEEAKRSTRPAVERATAILREAGLPPEVIEDSWYVAAREDSLAQEILRFAADGNYGTIVVGRSSLPWHRELFHQHIGERIVKHAEGRTVWVVE